MSNNTTNNQPKLGPVSQPSKLQKTKDGKYRIQKAVTKDELYDAVLHLIKEDYQREELTSSQDTRTYLRLKMMKYEQEVFAVVFLDSQHRVIAFEELFFGTINAAAVYPREVVKRGLYHNAGAMIFAHNHPSGHCQPSMADKQITKTLIEALALVDIRVLDHVIVGIDDTYSFAETGLI